MAIIYRPSGDTDLSNAVIVAETALPQIISSVPAGTYEFGRVAWQEADVVVTNPTVQTVWDQTAAGGTTVTITAERSSLQVNPEGFQFDVATTGFTSNLTAGVNTSYEAGVHELLVFWDYGDEYDYAAPTKVIEWDAADTGDRQNSRYSMGFVGSHTYRNAGNYTIRVAVYDPATGNWGQGTFNIGGASADTPAIGDSATLYATSQTVFVSTSGDYTNAPAGALTTTDINSALDTMQNATSATRLILERGQTHTISGGRNFARYLTSPDATLSNRIEANTGAGAKPILTISDAGFGPGGTLFNDASTAGDNPTVVFDTVFAGLDCRGLWDSTTETGDSVNFLGSFGQSATYTLFDECDFTGWKIVFNCGQERSKIYTLNDTSATDWQLYGLSFDSSQSSRAAFMGCRGAQNVNALAGGPTTPENSRNNQGPMRNAGSEKCLIWACDFFSNTGWTTRGSLFDPQPAIRVLQNMTTAGKKCYIGACVAEGGGTILAAENSQEGNTDKLVNLNVYGNFFLASWQTGRGFGLNYSGVTFAGNTMVVPAVDRDSNGAPLNGADGFAMAFIRHAPSGAGSDAGAYTQPVNVFNNTFVNLMADSDVTNPPATCSLSDNAGNGSIVVTFSNNINHQPNLGTPVETHTNLTAAQVFTHRYNGYKDANVSIADGLRFLTPAASASTFTPSTGSTALDAATTGDILRVGHIPNYNADTIIASNRDVGAIEA